MQTRLTETIAPLKNNNFEIALFSFRTLKTALRKQRYLCQKFPLPIPFCSWMFTSRSVVASLIALAHSLTHSILINLFIKLELNNFLLPPLLSIVFVQECSVVFRKVFDEGRLERPTFLPEKWRAWVRVPKIDLGGHCGFTCLQFFFRKYDGF